MTEVDVRPDLEEGREPFSRIMAAVDALADDGVLLLRAPFEPVPLLRVLARRGFEHFTERAEDGSFAVWFHRPAGGGAAPPPGRPGEQAAHAVAFVVVLDVRGLKPSELIARTLEALASLPAGGALLEVGERVPRDLLPVLAERGFHFDLAEESPGRVRLLIRRGQP